MKKIKTKPFVFSLLITGILIGLEYRGLALDFCASKCYKLYSKDKFTGYYAADFIDLDGRRIPNAKNGEHFCGRVKIRNWYASSLEDCENKKRSLKNIQCQYVDKMVEKISHNRIIGRYNVRYWYQLESGKICYISRNVL